MTDQKIGRLALRQEGENWNAYYAMADTMEGAILLGSIKLALVQRDDRKRAFMSLMKDCLGDMLKQTVGSRPTWPEGPQPAPEHERAGNA